MQDKRCRFNIYFQRDETNPPLQKKKACWKYPLRIVLEFFKNCQEYANIEMKSLKMLWEVVNLVKFEVFSLQLYC